MKNKFVLIAVCFLCFGFILFNSSQISTVSNTRSKEVVNNLIDKDAWELVKMTHEEDPWKNTERGDIITNESIYNYFFLYDDVC